MQGKILIQGKTASTLGQPFTTSSPGLTGAFRLSPVRWLMRSIRTQSPVGHDGLCIDHLRLVTGEEECDIGDVVWGASCKWII